MALNAVTCQTVLGGCRVLNLFMFISNKVANRNGLIFTHKVHINPLVPFYFKFPGHRGFFLDSAHTI